jgi:transcriptional regulator with XRE-family HTH domain
LAVSAYEAGRHFPKLKNIEKLAGFFEVSVDELCGITAENRSICITAETVQKEKAQQKKKQKENREFCQDFLLNTTQEIKGIIREISGGNPKELAFLKGMILTEFFNLIDDFLKKQ